uniref:Uncharacterized protein n=1 Tax=Sphaerodactylus townsendi TaxID=933632 RepID=A0ACB8ECN9_9SAUR
MGQVPDKDKEPCDPDSGDGKDALIPDRHYPPLGVAQRTSSGESMGSPYSWASSWRPPRRLGSVRPLGSSSPWTRTFIRSGTWWRKERDEMRQEIHFLRCNMELLLACAEAEERDRQDPLQLPPLQPSEGEQPVPMPPNDGLPGLLGPPQSPQAPQRRRRLKARFDGSMEKLAYFLVQVEARMEKHGGDYEDEVEQVHEVGALLEGAAAGWYVGLYKGRAPELRSFPHFMLALRQQFEDPFKEEKARARLRQIRQGSRSMSVYISEFHQLAGVVQDWLEQVQIHFFREGLRPEVAQWPMGTVEQTSLAEVGSARKPLLLHINIGRVLEQHKLSDLDQGDAVSNSLSAMKLPG